MEAVLDTPVVQLNPHRSPLITLISASGGVGKSTLALILAQLTAFEGIETAVIEGDLQFGDMGFWLGINVNSPSLSSGAACEPIAISNHLSLYKAPVLPELAEEISESVANLVDHVRSNYQLVIADTGQFWSGLTGELLYASDLVLLVMDHRKTSVYGAIKALELCRRMSIPNARIACVVNRASNISKSEFEKIQQLLGCSELFKLADGKAAVESLLEMGRLEEFIETEASPSADAAKLLGTLLPRVGLEFSRTPQKRTRRFFS